MPRLFRTLRDIQPGAPVSMTLAIRLPMLSQRFPAEIRVIAASCRSFFSSNNPPTSVPLPKAVDDAASATSSGLQRFMIRQLIARSFAKNWPQLCGRNRSFVLSYPVSADLICPHKPRTMAYTLGQFRAATAAAKAKTSWFDIRTKFHKF